MIPDFRCVFCLVLLWGVLTTVSQADEQYVVRSGDTLSKLAKKFYGDPTKWTLIYRENQKIILDRDKLKIGWQLNIPSQAKSSGVTDTQNEAIPLNSKIVRLVTGDSYLPFTDRTLYRDGMITDMVIRILKEMGYQRQHIEIEWWSWKHGFQATKESQFLATFPYLKNEERKKHFYYTASLYDVLVRWFVKTNSGLAQNLQAKDFDGLKTCKPEGYYQHDIKELVSQEKLKLVIAESIEECFEKLDKGKVDIISADEFVGQGTLAGLADNGKLDKKDFFMLDEPVITSGLHLIISKNNPNGCEFVYRFNEALETLDKQGVIDKVQKRHLDIYRDELGF